MADTKMKLPFPLDKPSDDEYAVDASAVGNMPAKLNSNGTGVQDAKATASGSYSHADNKSTASADYSHAEGLSTKAEGTYSHAEGMLTYATGSSSHAEGASTHAIGSSSHAEGNRTYANGTHSHAEGEETCTSNNGEHAEGFANVTTEGVTMHSVGCGYTETTEGETKVVGRNGEEITIDGKRYLLGVGGYDGTNVSDTDVKDEATIMNDTAKSIAPEYSASSTYAVDARVTYRGKLYKCTTAITTAEAWTASHWSEVDVDSYLTEFALEISQKGDPTDEQVDTAVEKYLAQNDSLIFETEEDGFAFVDSNYNIGVKIDSEGIHAPNILQYALINS